ncbi:hypothetical protein ASE90_01630 [Sphingomonas sp. Leaf67]|nr:hypothetical protein ASE90_01630 [Sphingomonas sp. Leaf67]
MRDRTDSASHRNDAFSGAEDVYVQFIATEVKFAAPLGNRQTFVCYRSVAFARPFWVWTSSNWLERCAAVFPCNVIGEVILFLVVRHSIRPSRAIGHLPIGSTDGR